jgi:hypothetical protein
MTALSRAGIQFTADQKETIKTMVATGDVMGAQKIILGELTAEFGGSAAAAGKTFSGQMDIARESLKNVGADILGMAMPALKGFASGLTDVVGRWASSRTSSATLTGSQASSVVIFDGLTGARPIRRGARCSGAFAQDQLGRRVGRRVGRRSRRCRTSSGRSGRRCSSVAGKVFGGLKAAFDADQLGRPCGTSSRPR